jgi:hypothetical protein
MGLSNWSCEIFQRLFFFWRIASFSLHYNMKKTKFLNFISKYNLGGIIPSVAISFGNSMTTKFGTTGVPVIGFVQMKECDFEVSSGCSVGIYNTDLLVKMLGAFNDDISIAFENSGGIVQDCQSATMLRIYDADATSTTATFVLGDLSVIPKGPTKSKDINYDFSFIVDKELIDKFIKAKSALADEDLCIISTKKSKGGQTVSMTLGRLRGSSNKITFNCKLQEGNSIPDGFESRTYSAKFIREIFYSNRDASNGEFRLVDSGMANIVFESDDFNTSYFVERFIDKGMI